MNEEGIIQPVHIPGALTEGASIEYLQALYTSLYNAGYDRATIQALLEQTAPNLVTLEQAVALTKIDTLMLEQKAIGIDSFKGVNILLDDSHRIHHANMHVSLNDFKVPIAHNFSFTIGAGSTGETKSKQGVPGGRYDLSWTQQKVPDPVLEKNKNGIVTSDNPYMPDWTASYQPDYIKKFLVLPLTTEELTSLHYDGQQWSLIYYAMSYCKHISLSDGMELSVYANAIDMKNEDRDCMTPELYQMFMRLEHYIHPGRERWISYQPLGYHFRRYADYLLWYNTPLPELPEIDSGL